MLVGVFTVHGDPGGEAGSLKSMRTVVYLVIKYEIR